MFASVGLLRPFAIVSAKLYTVAMPLNQAEFAHTPEVHDSVTVCHSPILLPVVPHELTRNVTAWLTA